LFPYCALTRVFELAFPDNAFERFLWVLDPILVIGSVGRKQLHHLIGAVGNHVTDGPGREIDGLADVKLVLFQRGFPGHQRRGLRHGFAPIRARPLPIRVNIAQKPLLPQKILFCTGNLSSQARKFIPSYFQQVARMPWSEIAQSRSAHGRHVLDGTKTRRTSRWRASAVL
jgi:hypothetical protein